MNHKEFTVRHQALKWNVNYWYSYVYQGLRNEISGHCRKDQRTYQRHFCSCYSKLQRFREQYPEFLI